MILVWILVNWCEILVSMFGRSRLFFRKYSVLIIKKSWRLIQGIILKIRASACTHLERGLDSVVWLFVDSRFQGSKTFHCSPIVTHYSETIYKPSTPLEFKMHSPDTAPSWTLISCDMAICAFALGAIIWLDLETRNVKQFWMRDFRVEGQWKKWKGWHSPRTDSTAAYHPSPQIWRHIQKICKISGLQIEPAQLVLTLCHVTWYMWPCRSSIYGV